MVVFLATPPSLFRLFVTPMMAIWSPLFSVKALRQCMDVPFNGWLIDRGEITTQPKTAEDLKIGQPIQELQQNSLGGKMHQCDLLPNINKIAHQAFYS